jgi:hypothetical protein
MTIADACGRPGHSCAASFTCSTRLPAPPLPSPPPPQLLTGVRILRLWRVLRMVSGFYRGAYLAGEVPGGGEGGMGVHG